MDAQTHVEHTLGITALIQAMVKELAEHYEAGGRLSHYPYEMLDENRWLAARHGLEGELVDLPERKRVPTKELARRLYDRLSEHAADLGGANELEGVLDLIERGTGAHRQRVVYEANRDFTELLREIIEATGA
jgi:carboxylate-amine ligase